jgi:hypothetical protein
MILCDRIDRDKARLSRPCPACPAPRFSRFRANLVGRDSGTAGTHPFRGVPLSCPGQSPRQWRMSLAGQPPYRGICPTLKTAGPGTGANALLGQPPYLAGPSRPIGSAGGAERDVRFFENLLQLAEGNRPTVAYALPGQPPYPNEEANP